MTKSQHMRSTMMIKGLKVGERAKSLGMRTNLTRGTRGGRVRREKSGQGEGMPRGQGRCGGR